MSHTQPGGQGKNGLTIYPYFIGHASIFAPLADSSCRYDPE